MKICPICKKEHDTKWKYCSNECVSKAKDLAVANRNQFLLELEDELLPPHDIWIIKMDEQHL